jgi:hypothetical protein
MATVTGELGYGEGISKCKVEAVARHMGCVNGNQVSQRQPNGK